MLVTLSKLYPENLGYSVHMLSIPSEMPGIVWSGYARYSLWNTVYFDNQYPEYPNVSKHLYSVLLIQAWVFL